MQIKDFHLAAARGNFDKNSKNIYKLQFYHKKKNIFNKKSGYNKKIILLNYDKKRGCGKQGGSL